ncbi:MAG TPA: stage II sporulation protein M [Gaiellaceae bacterium]
MNLARFVRERRPAWTELDALLAEAKRRPERLGPDGVLRLGELYRATAADLARARSAFPGDPLVRALEHRLVRARHLVYDAPTRRDSLLEFVRRGYWQEVRRRPLPLLIAAVLLLAPAGLAGTWAYRDPGSAAALAPDAYRSVTEPRKDTDLGLSASEEAALSSEIFTNNIRVTLMAFAGGIALGVGAGLLLVYNGVVLGVVAGLAVQAGNGRPFFELVTAHGVLELSCIVVAGAAGMRLGWAIVEPGRRTRAAALGREGRRAVAMVLGTAPWLVVAGIVEGFVTPSGFGLAVVAAVGFTLALTYWSLVVFAARRAPATSP